MACPFSRVYGRSRVDEGGEEEGERDIGNDRMKKKERYKPSRQSSIQITSSLLGEEIDDQEDTQTLNLKHLRAAVLILTNPSVLILSFFYLIKLKKKIKNFICKKN